MVMGGEGEVPMVTPKSLVDALEKAGRAGDLGLAVKMQSVFDECAALAAKKNNDYSGGKKIDNIALTGTYGVGVRLMDKVCRVLSLHEVGSLVKTESLRDTALDIINYSCFLVLLLDGKWGKDGEEKSVEK